jgi:hypothetical protein
MRREKEGRMRSNVKEFVDGNAVLDIERIRIKSVVKKG